MVGDPLASVLRSGRDVFNSKFVQARRRFPNLDPVVFTEFLESCIDPLAKSLPLRGDALATWVQSAYDVALELAGEGAVGHEGKGRVIAQAWKRILPSLPLAVLGSGEIVLGALSNAVHFLTHSRAARVDEWITTMQQVSPLCATSREFLQAGQVAAWRAGTAHHRKGALQVAALLPEGLTRGVLGLNSDIPLAPIFARLEENVWFEPSVMSATAASRLSPVRKVGGFRGLGGEFSQPPLVAAGANGQLLVRSAEDAWVLSADVYGSSLHRASPSEFELATTAPRHSEHLQVTSRRVAIGGLECPIELPGEITSFALLRDTVAVTASHTFAIQLLSR